MIPFNYVIVQVWASFILSSLSPIQTFKPLFPITNLEESSESAAELEMARNYGFLVCIFVMVIDAVAGLLGIEAEKAQNRVVLESLSISVGECSRKPRDDAFSRGLAASILLGLAHVIAKVLGGKCICIRNKQNSQKPSANQLLGLLFMILSWITLAIGFSVLMAATMDNSKWKNSCEVSSHGLFLGGGIVCFFHGLCTVAYYVSATAAYREEQRDSKPSPSEPQRV